MSSMPLHEPITGEAANPRDVNIAVPGMLFIGGHLIVLAQNERLMYVSHFSLSFSQYNDG